ncbi:hypothetical protein AN478_02455 [Thiohalorhabdus denitrificans]|uniref:Ribbon-helix-helix protein, copG family n=1 Tax=Thiohalorhabdus denitrificans TaxID=381306 RepID=A0A0P9C866_9GAMM|nr:hypothetical protein [Thiohalorhabdus denitrificans]KPV41451.1 hypothetical protein AN478_02455 [Thiohalorhabdus denitrificans]SCY27959.1 hypothetical protein SAMN05661077_1688 [Thiohalorhabdus denitrificans]
MSTQLTLRISDDLLAQAQEQAGDSRAEVLRRWVEMGARAEESVRNIQDQVDALRRVVEEQQALIERQAERQAQEAQDAKARDDALARRVEELMKGLKAQDQHAQILKREVSGLWRGLGAQLLSRRKRDNEAAQAEAQELRELAGLK